MSEVPVNELIADMPDEVYHGLSGSYSSSQLKDMLKDPEIFYKKYITKEIPRQNIPAFAVGTYFHTAVLEPHKLHETCAVYEGARRGAKWDEFQAANENKAIITKTEHAKAKLIIDAVHASPMAMDYVNSGDAEVSAFIEIYVFYGEVFAAKGKQGFRLDEGGWTKVAAKAIKAAIADGVKLTIKVRADILGEEGYVGDLKSTTGNVKDRMELAKKVSNYDYDLSASLYLDIFTFVTGKLYNKFIWIWAAKDTGMCSNSIASTRNMMVGRAKYKKALVMIAYYITNEWEFNEELLVVEPTFYDEREWLVKADEDEL